MWRRGMAADIDNIQSRDSRRRELLLFATSTDTAVTSISAACSRLASSLGH